MTHLLDSNAWIESLNRPFGRVGTRLTNSTPSDLGLCSVSVGELLTGAEKSIHPANNRAKVEDLIQQFGCLPYDEVSAEWYARIRSYLERIGLPIGSEDTQIAAIAFQHGLMSSPTTSASSPECRGWSSRIGRCREMRGRCFNGPTLLAR